MDTTFLPSAESTIGASVLFPGDAIRGRVLPKIVSLTTGGVLPVVCDGWATRAPGQAA